MLEQVEVQRNKKWVKTEQEDSSEMQRDQRTVSTNPWSSGNFLWQPAQAWLARPCQPRAVPLRIIRNVPGGKAVQAKRNRDSYTDAETIQHYRRREPLAHNRHLIICDGELVDIWSQIQWDYRAEKCREGCESKRIGQIPEALKTFQGVWWRRGKRSSSIKLAKSTLFIIRIFKDNPDINSWPRSKGCT